VLPSYRRQGIAKRLLKRIVLLARERDRRLLITDTMSKVPAGEAFMQWIGAEKALESHTSQLVIAELDRTLISRWIDGAQERAAGFELGLWDGPYPDEELEAILSLYELINQQPFGELDIEDFVFTAEAIRQDEDRMYARGYERWTLFARETATGAFAGYTEVFWSPNRPEIIGQGMTGVFPAFRNKGIGRWLKAAMMEKILAERPGVKYIRTGNADSNAPMVKINHEMGFKPYISWSSWQFTTDRAAEVLGLDV
jgi:GNAT superfamily N-acetyltransferase